MMEILQEVVETSETFYRPQNIRNRNCAKKMLKSYSIEHFELKIKVKFLLN